MPICPYRNCQKQWNRYDSKKTPNSFPFHTYDHNLLSNEGISCPVLVHVHHFPLELVYSSHIRNLGFPKGARAHHDVVIGLHTHTAVIILANKHPPSMWEETD